MAITPDSPKKSRKLRDPNKVKLNRAGKPRNPELPAQGPVPKYTPEMLIKAYIENGMSITKACKAIGCTRDLHYGYLATDPSYPAMFEQARDLFLEKAEAIIDDELDNHININDLKRELKQDPRYTPQPDDTPDIISLKQKIFMGRIREAQELNAMAHDTMKFVAKLRGSKAGWREKTEVEHSGQVSMADLLNSETADQKKTTQGPKSEASDGVANLLDE